MPNQEPRLDNQQNIDGKATEPIVIPMEDPAAAGTRTLTTEEVAAGASDQGASQAKPNDPGSLEYWKGVAQTNREHAEKFAEYSTLIGHLEKNPDHVEVLTKGVEGHTIGIIAAENMASQAAAQRRPSQEELLSAELGVESSPEAEGTAMQNPQKPAYQPTNEELIKHGEQRAKAKMEFDQFRQDMHAKGVPDHALDEYVQYLRNPNGLNHYDLYVAFNNFKTRTQGETNEGTPNTQQADPQGQPPVGAPISVTSMPAGATDRPESNAYVGEVDGNKFVQNPSDI